MTLFAKANSLELILKFALCTASRLTSKRILFFPRRTDEQYLANADFLGCLRCSTRKAQSSTPKRPPSGHGSHRQADTCTQRASMRHVLGSHLNWNERFCVLDTL